MPKIKQAHCECIQDVYCIYWGSDWAQTNTGELIISALAGNYEIWIGYEKQGGKWAWASGTSQDFINWKSGAYEHDETALLSC